MQEVFEKIIEHLENASFWTDSSFDEDGYSNDDSEEVVDLHEAIEIVKQGGVSDVPDDVCEWRCDAYGRWHTECHILADNDPLEYTYCPYCGKKILCKE